MLKFICNQKLKLFDPFLRNDGLNLAQSSMACSVFGCITLVARPYLFIQKRPMSFWPNSLLKLTNGINVGSHLFSNGPRS